MPIILDGGGSSAGSTGLCGAWATVEDLCSPCMEQEYNIDSVVLESYLQTASEILYDLSGRQYPGTCSETIAPCMRPMSTIWAAPNIPGMNPLLRNAYPWGGCGCATQTSCRCSSHSALELPHGPVIEVTEVIVDGYALDPSSYELEGNLLIRTDGDHWPCCDEDFFISYDYGLAPPSLGIKAAGILACELLMACDEGAIEGAKCRLPRNVTSIARQGVSIVFQSLTQGSRFRFGIWEIDLFLETYNPYNLKFESVMMNPDTVPLARRIT